ncbi:DNA-3-methyladenine glycosylase family protein [Gordonia insulae]|uniref:DNA-3-methyladenine glycosylase II n=1 Tax=Gordonia insulae TaxID=2420509 RepID=A0A3G8JQ29_9ACTN|nr:DNA-3-methyladenine glycosylase [Gordonia insulae]AZG47201.1 DNA-3-methyladenine glycosylase [Gordonia insulae]
MSTHTVRREVLGPWSLDTSREFWEGFTPAALDTGQKTGTLSTVFRVDADWSAAQVTVTQRGPVAELSLSGDGDLDSAAAQTARFLALDVDARDWPGVGDRDVVIGRAQQALPGLRPCGFHSAYEAAAWSVLSQRIRMAQAAALRQRITDSHGDDGAFPTPERLATLDLELPGRKAEYLHAVADAALDGRLDTARLRAMAPEDAIESVQSITGIGPFAAELIVLRGANAPDAVPTHEKRLNAVVTELYGPDRSVTEVSELWRPFRTWASVYLRAGAERH